MPRYSGGSLVAACGCEGECEKRFLFQLMRLRGSRGGAGAGRALDRANAESEGLGKALQPGQNIGKRSHVCGFFLYPHDLARTGMMRNDISAPIAHHPGARHGVQILHAATLAPAPLDAQLMAVLAVGAVDAS